MVNSVSFVTICSASLSTLAMAQYGYAPSAGHGYGAQFYRPSGSFREASAQAHQNSHDTTKNTKVGTSSNRNVHDYTKSVNENHTKLDQTTDKLEETKEKYNNANKYANAKYYGYPYGYGSGYGDQYSYEYCSYSY